MKSKYIISTNKVLNDGNVILTLNEIIEDVIVLEDTLVILFKGSDSNDRNIICYFKTGNIKWQIPKPDQLHDRNYYTSIYTSSSNDLMAYNINGVEVTINKETGDILKKELVK